MRDLLREIGVTLGILVTATLAMHVLLALAPREAGPIEAGDGAWIRSERLLEGDFSFLFTYANWAASVLSGDWGLSETGDPVAGILRGAVPITFGLLLLALAGSTVLSTAFAWKVASGRSRGARIVSGLIGSASLVPVYLLAFAAAKLWGGALYPARGESLPPASVALLVVQLAGLTAIGNGVFAESVGSLKAALRHELAEPYVLSLAARRVPLRRHVLRNLAPVVLGLSASHIPRLLTVVFILEWAFNLPGLGLRGLEAFDVGGRRDANLILAVTVVSVLLVRVLLGASRAAASRLAPQGAAA